MPKYRNTVRTCYPSSGVEADLAEAVIFECSRWDPEDAGFVAERDIRRRLARERAALSVEVDIG